VRACYYIITREPLASISCRFDAAARWRRRLPFACIFSRGNSSGRLIFSFFSFFHLKTLVSCFSFRYLFPSKTITFRVLTRIDFFRFGFLRGRNSRRIFLSTILIFKQVFFENPPVSTVRD